MRIACIHIPQFALQCATRLDPSLRGAAVAVVSGVGPTGRSESGPQFGPGRERAAVLHAPVVLACSRAAWALGVRLGMTAVTARAQGTRVMDPSGTVRPGHSTGEIAIVTADAGAERETTRAIADAVLALAPTVDVGGRVGAGGAHLAMYCEVPSKTRGNAFGDKLVELLAELGLSARIGIADDRFTAWVAAAYGPVGAKADHDHHDGAVVSVPRGGSPAFLSPRPLSLLAIPAEVQHMLESLGVTTLGEFAALPAPSVARPFEADYQALARGESGAVLRPYHPEAAIREEIVVSASTVLELPGSLSGPAAIAQLARRIALRLAGRNRGAARLDVSMIAASGEAREVPVTIDGASIAALGDAEEIARVLAPVLDTAQEDMPQLASQGGWRLRVVVTGESLVGGEAIEILDEGTAPLVRVAEDALVQRIDDGTAPVARVAEGTAPVARVAQGSSPVRVPEANVSPRASNAASASSNAASASSNVAGRSQQAAGVPHPMLPLEPPVRATPSYTHAANANEPDPLAIVLSSSGSLFVLSSPTFGDRREAHRRTRRGKQRRNRPTPSVQPRLFDRSNSK